MNVYRTYAPLLFWRFAAVACGLAAIVGAWVYPVAGAMLAVGLVVYALCLWRLPTVWLFVLPALLPVLDLTPWSGWFFLEEIDLFVFVTLALGYWRLPGHAPTLTISLLGTMLLTLLGVSYAVALGIGIMPLSPLDANAFSNHLSHYNSLRILKGFVWALLLLPLLKRATAYEPEAFSRWLVPGMLAGLCGATLVAWWERWTFGSLADFATDYRITGMFSAMHLGGAALDGYLALSLPFLLAWIMTRSGWKQSLFAATLFFTASYAVMATFARGLYLAYALTILFGLIAVFRSGAARPQRGREAMAALVALLVAGGLLWQAFGAGGYRALGALLALFAALVVVVPLLHRGANWFGALLLLPVALALTWSLGLVLDKGPYIAFALSAALLVIAVDLTRAQSDGARRAGQLLAAMGLLWLGVNAVWVARHWGGERAMWDAAVAAGACALGLIFALRAPKVWALDKRNFLLLGIGLVALAMLIPATHSYRMQDRFGEAKQDFSGRLAHWRAALGVMEPGQWAFGAGLGRFAEAYFWKNPLGEFPGTYRLSNEAGRHAIQLAGARYAQGFGESLRVGQRVGLSQPGLYTLQLEARTTAPKLRLEVVLCEKWLLYRGQCAGQDIALQASKAPWQTVRLVMDGKKFSSAPWYARPTMQFSIANDTAGAVVEVASVSLQDAAGRELLRNGDFTAGFNHWFFTSDHHHLPWHAKNIGLNVYFDQGVLGLGAFFLVLAYALARLARDGTPTGIPALALMAALGGFLVVGLFDSLLDVPRLAWLFYLVVLIAMLKPRKYKQRRARPSAKLN